LTSKTAGPILSVMRLQKSRIMRAAGSLRRKELCWILLIAGATALGLPAGGAPVLSAAAGESGGGAVRKLPITARYLHLPVRPGAPKRRMQLRVEGRLVDEFDIEYAPSKPAFRVFVDLGRFLGKGLEARINLAGGDAALAALRLAERVPGAERMYREPLRPQFHFTSRRGWHNDPNGLVWYEGEYHLYYQHNPYGVGWGNMHWGHAVSPDLVHWRELPEALYPPRYGDWCFSGSAVVDKQNTSGWAKSGRAPLVVFWTSTGRGECVAYSLDRGRTFTEYEGNPVVRHRGRDPRVLWHAPSRAWVMAVYDESAGGHDVAFYRSKDLKKWEYAGRIQGFYECPNLFELPVQGKPGRKLWVLYGADGAYVLGRFDGRRFVREAGKFRLWHGNFYAAQTFSNEPKGRRIQIGWGRGVEFPGMPFNQQMTLPVELSLRETPDGVRLFACPVSELERLYREGRRWARVGPVDGRCDLGVRLSDPLCRIRLRARPQGARQFGLEVCGLSVVGDLQKRRLNVAGLDAPLPIKDGAADLDVWVDRGSIEVFAGGGGVAVSRAARPNAGKPGLVLFSRGGATVWEEVRLWKLGSIWTNPPSGAGR